MIPADTSDISKEYKILLNELKEYNPELLDKHRVLAITKCDLLDEELKEEIQIEIPADIQSFLISSVTEEGLSTLKDALWQKLNG
jgi:GTP-binding protein